MRRSLLHEVQRFPLAEAFVIARGSKSEAAVIVVSIRQGDHVGRGECVPYARYGESLDSVGRQIRDAAPAIEAGAGREDLQRSMPASAARNALDCALWDLEAKRLGVPVTALAGVHRLSPATTAYTLSLGTPKAMAAAARAAAHRPILKVKLGGAGDPDRIRAVRTGAPDASLIVDANEAWGVHDLEQNFEACLEAGVALVEQPLPAGQDDALAGLARPVPTCADESVHDRAGLERLRDRYDVINVKLDKTGGLTEALSLCGEAERLGFGLFIGCMVGSSLAMAPAMLLTPRARFVDLDGPLLLARDRADGLVYDGSIIRPPTPALWG